VTCTVRGCQTCPAGTFSNDTGSSRCSDCPPGFYCPVAGATTPIACPLGSVCAGRAASSPVPCLTGTYCNNFALTQSNVWVTDSLFAFTCAGATGRNIWDSGFSNYCIFYTAADAEAYCLSDAQCVGYASNCPQAGRCIFQVTRQSQLSAGSGTFFAKTIAPGVAPVSCPAGFFCNATGLSAPWSCAPELYSVGGQTACTACTAGFTSFSSHLCC
jgi:hypothetical protein